MKKRWIVGSALVGVMLVLPGCIPTGDGGCPTCPGSGGSARVVVPFETLDQGEHSGIRDTRMQAVRDEAAWVALWAEHTAGREPTPAIPEIDFAREMAVVFFWGEKPTSGHEAEITEISLGAERAVVRVELRAPAPGGVVLPVLTQPFHVVKLPRFSPPVEFATVEMPEREYDCCP